MKITDILQNSKQAFASFELVPPLKGNDSEKLYSHLQPLMDFSPPFINITCHRDEIKYAQNQDGSIRKTLIKKRPGTLAIIAAILRKYEIEIVPHVICGGASRQKIEDELLDFNFLGIENIMALRGDAQKEQKSFIPEIDGYHNAFQLVKHVKRLNNGIFLDSEELSMVKTNFCIGVGCYPEKHREATDIQSDIVRLKEKVDSGANYIVTQMFFDNSYYYSFVEKCRQAGINVPIIPGLKPVSTLKQMNILPKLFSINMPQLLLEEITRCKSDIDIYNLGIEWCINQSKDLLKHDIPVIHYYTMGKADNIKQIITSVF
ncbi:MAG: methylenetetrahydrofolate reductase [Prevotellaceae bacterium]|jgi:methylenetetrahydrofolate reductase (NADPH)|nr:methylenetetrahydrofolate reductase [Prevotellaceae bacterium]